MGKFKLYNVDLKNLSPGVHEFEYLLENKFFVDIDGTEVQKGKVKVHLTVKRSSMMFEMNFQIEGVVVVPCDRCLDDMEIPIDTHNRLVVKFGKEYAEESDEVVVIPEEEGAINLAWFLYEFIALAVPMKHVHAPGKCNKAMSSKLKKHTATVRANCHCWSYSLVMSSSLGCSCLTLSSFRMCHCFIYLIVIIL